jgi:hypothetical protein
VQAVLMEGALAGALIVLSGNALWPQVLWLHCEGRTLNSGRRIGALWSGRTSLAGRAGALANCSLAARIHQRDIDMYTYIKTALQQLQPTLRRVAANSAPRARKPLCCEHANARPRGHDGLHLRDVLLSCCTVPQAPHATVRSPALHSNASRPRASAGAATSAPHLTASDQCHLCRTVLAARTASTSRTEHSITAAPAATPCASRSVLHGAGMAHRVTCDAAAGRGARCARARALNAWPVLQAPAEHAVSASPRRRHA